jgi:F420-dependent oxidoreductase-like protein
MKPWFGLHLPNYTFPDSPPEQLFDRIVEQAHTAEECGFALVTVMDHLFQIGGVGPEDAPMLESYSVLSALARETKTVRLGTLVTGVTYRNPAFLAKTVTTLDVISGGRAILGLGAAWNEDEHTAFGYDFPPVKERMDRLDDALAIAKGMFTGERFSYDGTYSSVTDIIESPRPIQAGGPKIMVGGGGEQRTLRIAAKYADMTHWFPSGGLDVLNHKTEVMTGYCQEIGRNPAEIERTMGAPVVPVRTDAERDAFLERIPAERRSAMTVGSPQQCADALKPFVDAGFTGFTFGNTVYQTPEQIKVVGETLSLIGG